MKKLDYWQSSLDFCLYPDDVVKRFSGKEVIVYGTNYENLTFLSKFFGYLKINYMINHFDENDFKNSYYIRDLDEMTLNLRTTEPIFILSRKFWLEIMNYLERKGLVLGSDFFFWNLGNL